MTAAPEHDLRTGQWKYRIEGLDKRSKKSGCGFYLQTREQSGFDDRFQEELVQEEYHCSTCGEPAKLTSGAYHDRLSGLSNVFLHDIETAHCDHCGNTDIIIPYMLSINRAIALAVLTSPYRLTGPQLTLLRSHSQKSPADFAQFIAQDEAQLARWEEGEEPIPPSTDRLIRLSAVALDEELKPHLTSVFAQFPKISNEPGDNWEIHIDVAPSGVGSKQAA